MAAGTFQEFYCDASIGSNMYGGNSSGAPIATYTGGTWVSATCVFTLPSGSTAGVNVGDYANVYPDGATTPVFISRITSIVANTSITTSSATFKVGTAPVDGITNTTLVVGGCWKGPNGTNNFPFGLISSTLAVSGTVPRINFKNNATYSVTASIVSNVGGQITYQGYSSTVGDGGKATIDGGSAGASYILLDESVATPIFVDFIFSNNGATGTAALVKNGTTTMFVRCVFTGGVAQAIHQPTSSAIGTYIECEIYGNNTATNAGLGAFVSSTTSLIFCLRCYIHNNSSMAGYQASSTGAQNILIDCIVDGNGNQGFLTASGTNILLNTDFYNNGSNAIEHTANNPFFYIENCNFIKNSGWAALFTSTGKKQGFMYNSGYGAGTQVNTSGTISNQIALNELGSVTYGSNLTPWNAPSTGDFTITLAAAKNAGRYSLQENGNSKSGTVGYPDIGSAQHLDTVKPTISYVF